MINDYLIYFAYYGVDMGDKLVKAIKYGDPCAQDLFWKFSDFIGFSELLCESRDCIDEDDLCNYLYYTKSLL